MRCNANKKRQVWQWILRISLTVACIAMLCFIFSNSLKDGEASVQQSSTVVKVVQDVAAVVAPNSGIATATGEDYERLHDLVRTVAHFAEFMLFGALLLWCAASYTWKKRGFCLALLGVLCVPIIDEILQVFVAGRGAEFCDVCTDVAGGVCGILFAILTLLVIVAVADRRSKKREDREDSTVGL
ncbi:MAG: VanZ family protein [Clostridia bacterium]|nr:VanZ family protein [Clostridia bacterium]